MNAFYVALYNSQDPYLMLIHLTSPWCGVSRYLQFPEEETKAQPSWKRNDEYTAEAALEPQSPKS